MYKVIAYAGYQVSTAYFSTRAEAVEAGTEQVKLLCLLADIEIVGELRAEQDVTQPEDWTIYDYAGRAGSLTVEHITLGCWD